MSGEGCWVSDFTRTQLICACNHLTDFSGFVEASYTPLLESNYKAITVIPNLTWKKLVYNVGSYISLVYFASYFFFILTRCCRKGFQNHTKILKLLESELDLPHSSKYLFNPEHRTESTDNMSEISESVDYGTKNEADRKCCGLFARVHL